MVKEFKLKQKATQVPELHVKTYARVYRLDRKTIFIELNQYWIRIDLSDNTFAIGDYEG